MKDGGVGLGMEWTSHVLLEGLSAHCIDLSRRRLIPIVELEAPTLQREQLIDVPWPLGERHPRAGRRRAGQSRGWPTRYFSAVTRMCLPHFIAPSLLRRTIRQTG